MSTFYDHDQNAEIAKLLMEHPRFEAKEGMIFVRKHCNMVSRPLVMRSGFSFKQGPVQAYLNEDVEDKSKLRGWLPDISDPYMWGYMIGVIVVAGAGKNLDGMDYAATEGSYYMGWHIARSLLATFDELDALENPS